jgi:hypothetical protein
MTIPAGGGHVHLLLLGSGGPLWPLVLLFLVSMYRCACYFFVLLAAGGPLSLGKKTGVRTQHLTPTVTPKMIGPYFFLPQAQQDFRCVPVFPRNYFAFTLGSFHFLLSFLNVN